MADDKVLINFRISKDRKRQLEYLAEKKGLSITQYLDTKIFREIQHTLENEARDEAFEKAAIKAGIDPAIARVMTIYRENLGLYKYILKDELAEKIWGEYAVTSNEFVNTKWQEFGLTCKINPLPEPPTPEENDKNFIKIEQIYKMILELIKFEPIINVEKIQEYINREEKNNDT